MDDKKEFQNPFMLKITEDTRYCIGQIARWRNKKGDEEEHSRNKNRLNDYLFGTESPCLETQFPQENGFVGSVEVSDIRFEGNVAAFIASICRVPISREAVFRALVHGLDNESGLMELAQKSYVVGAYRKGNTVFSPEVVYEVLGRRENYDKCLCRVGELNVKGDHVKVWAGQGKHDKTRRFDLSFKLDH